MSTPAGRSRRLGDGRDVSRAAGLLFALVLVLTGCAGASEEPRSAVMIGVGSTVEQRTLAGLARVALARAEIPSEISGDLGGTRDLRREAMRGRVDLFWDYTGAAWALGLGGQAPPADPTESWERVRSADEENGLEWLAPSDANATLGLFVRTADLPPPNEPRGMNWLAGVLSSGEERLCADPDFIARPDGVAAFAQEYAIDPDRLRSEPVAEVEAIEAVAAGRCFAALATATSGIAHNAGLSHVADELSVFPAFVVAPVVREGSPADVAEVREALVSVTRRLDTWTLAVLNAEVESGADPETVAEQFLSAGAESPAE